MPTKVKDYISFPKPNGYQSLHTALMYKGQSVEVQIRTSYMHQVAEYGMASHWAYTDEKKRNSSMDLYNTPWLSSIKEWQQEAVGSRDFVDCVRRELLGKRVFVFLRNGKILNLARGATAVDAAFQIHTEVGLNVSTPFIVLYSRKHFLVSKSNQLSFFCRCTGWKSTASLFRYHMSFGMVMLYLY